jgi:hypothetical protein
MEQCDYVDLHAVHEYRAARRGLRGVVGEVWEHVGGA